MDVVTYAMAKGYADKVVESAVTPLSNFVDNTDIDMCYDEETGANYHFVRIYKNRIDGTRQFPFVICPDGTDGGTMSTKELQEAYGYCFAINAGIFHVDTRKPDGMVIAKGKVVQSGSTTTWLECPPLTINTSGDLSYAAYDADAQTLVNSGIYSAVCGFMPIIIDYDKVPDTDWNDVSQYAEHCQRQIIGQFGNGDYGILTCEGRNYDNSDGWDVYECQDMCVKYGFKFAYLLDGGGSTETMFGLRHVNTIYERGVGRIVPTFIVFTGENKIEPDAPFLKFQSTSFKNIDPDYTSAYMELLFNYELDVNNLVVTTTGDNIISNTRIIKNGQHVLFYFDIVDDGDCSVTIRDIEQGVSTKTALSISVDRIDKSGMAIQEKAAVYSVSSGDFRITVPGEDGYRWTFLSQTGDFRSFYDSNLIQTGWYPAMKIRKDITKVHVVGLSSTYNHGFALLHYDADKDIWASVYNPGWKAGEATYDISEYIETYYDEDLYFYAMVRRSDWQAPSESEWATVSESVNILFT